MMEEILKANEEENKKLKAFYNYAYDAVRDIAASARFDYKVRSKLVSRTKVESCPTAGLLGLLGLKSSEVVYDKLYLVTENAPSDGCFEFEFYVHIKDIKYNRRGMIIYHEQMGYDIVRQIIKDNARELCDFIVKETGTSPPTKLRDDYDKSVRVREQWRKIFEDKGGTDAVVIIGKFEAILKVSSNVVKRGMLSVSMIENMPPTESADEKELAKAGTATFIRYDCAFIGFMPTIGGWIPVFKY